MDSEGLAAVSDELVRRYPASLPDPVIFPTADGNLLLEWELPRDPSLEIDLKARRAKFHALDEDEEVEAEFALAGEGSWNALFSFLQ